LRRITLPLLSPTILTVTIAGLIRSLEAFEIEQLLGTPAGIDVYSTRIFEMISWEPPRFPAAMALSTFFLAVLFVLALFYQRFTRKREFTTIGTRGVSLRPIMVGRWRYIASAFCLTCSGLWIVLPVLMLIIGSFMRLYGFFSINAPFTSKHWMSTFSDPLLLICLKNSLIVALAVGVIGLAVYATIAYVVVRTTIPARSAISILAWLPWAVPGILLGVALLWLLLSLPGMSIFYGTFVPLILVLIVKEMPIGTHMMKTALGQISKELEEASWVCGASRFTTFRRISLPLITPTLVSIFAIVLIAALRDISTTILLVTANTRSLAILMMEYSRGGQLEVASIIGVLITTVAILMAMVARRVGLRMSMEV
jgi:iron(III) transport system permease protein